MVLFTFVVMLLNVGVEEKTHGSRVAKIIGFPAVVVILGVISTFVLSSQQRLSPDSGGISLSSKVTTTQDLSRVLFHELLLPFELTSVLILIAILGAVALAQKEGA